MIRCNDCEHFGNILVCGKCTKDDCKFVNKVLTSCLQSDTMKEG